MGSDADRGWRVHGTLIVMLNIIPGYLIGEQLRANTLVPVIHCDDTLKLMGVSSLGVSQTLTCAGLPDIDTIIADHPNAIEVLTSWAFYWSLDTVLSLQDTSLTEINDGHVVTKFSPKNKQDLPLMVKGQMKKAMAGLSNALGVVQEPLTIGIAVGKSSKVRWAHHVCVENAL